MAAASGGRPAVGPLLSFADRGLEDAFAADFHARQLDVDRLQQSTVFTCDLLLLAWKLAPRRRWAACAGTGLEVAAALALLLWRRLRPAAYLRRRSAVLSAVWVVHALVAQNNQPMGVESTCRAPAAANHTPPDALGGAVEFWLHEALLQLIPWTGLYPWFGPLPLQTAVWAQGAAVGVLMLPPVAARRLEVSTQLCPTAGARYVRAVRYVCTLLACMLPPALGAGVLHASQQLSEPAAYHLLSALAQLLFSFVAPLAVLARREHGERLAFAAARGDAAAVAGLARWRRRWRLGPLEWVLLASYALCSGVLAAHLLSSTA